MTSLSQWLLESKLLVPEQLQEAQRKQVESGITLEMALIELGLVKEADLVDMLAGKHKLPKAPARLHRTSIPLTALSMVPQDLCLQHALIPFGLDTEERTLHVAIVDPSDDEAITAVKKITGFDISLYVIGPRRLEKAIRKHYMDSLVDDTNAKGRRFFGYDEITDPGSSPTLGEITAGLKNSGTPSPRTDLPEPPPATGLEFVVDETPAANSHIKETKQYPATGTPIAVIPTKRAQVKNSGQAWKTEEEPSVLGQRLHHLEQATFQILALIASLELTAEQREKVQLISNDLLTGPKK